MHELSYPSKKWQEQDESRNKVIKDENVISFALVLLLFQ